MARASARERSQHLSEAILQGGSVMTARGGLVRRMEDLPTPAQLASTPAERREALQDLERRKRELELEQQRLLDAEAGDVGEQPNLKIGELKERARQLGIEGAATMKKDELITAISEAERA